MLASLRRVTDRLLGRGAAAITVPVMDGALKPNRLIDEAEHLADLPDIDDLSTSDGAVWASAGSRLYRLDTTGLVPVLDAGDAITALAFSPGGRMALALAGRRIVVVPPGAARTSAGRASAPGAAAARAGTGAPHDLAALAPAPLSLDTLAGRPLHAVNALAWHGEDQLLFTDGSERHAPADWCRDLMTLGDTGRAGRWRPDDGDARLVADGLAHAFGAAPAGTATVVCESWRHRLLTVTADGRRQPLLSELPGYPSRLIPAADGGWWVSCFVCRTQLVEFVLREAAYRNRMIAEVDPAYWIAPALSSGRSFLEPLQGAGVKNMGVLKPWAPPRSYGLVIKVAGDGRIERSLHSQVDGRHHGITAVAELPGSLYLASKGSGRLLRVSTEGSAAREMT